MKKLLSLIILGLFFIVLGCEKDSLFDTTLDNDSKVSVREITADVEAMIDGGVNWLLTQRHPDGYFSDGEDVVARTAMAVVKLCDRSIELGWEDPLQPGAPYRTEILAGLTYIVSQERDYPGIGVAYHNLLASRHHENYNTSWALMAFVASRDADYLSYAQGAADYFINSQAANGGWGYNAGTGWDGNVNWQDNSNTGYVVLALVAARNFGCLGIDNVLPSHENWVDLIQDNTNGGSWYTPTDPWINVLKTGNLLFEMAFVGDKFGDSPRVQFAVDYIQNTWNAPGGGTNSPGWKPKNYQAMYTMMKGFSALGIDEINVGGPVDWYAAFVEEIDATKISPVLDMYYWPSAGWGDEYVNTVFALLTLEKIVELPRIEVNLDIKPTSCPNPFNMKANGVLPVAILGSAECDVSQIDVSSLYLEGVSPIRSNLEDVAAPLIDPTEECECTTAGPDGYMDLTLKFNRQDIAAALGDVNDGDVIPLTINGELFSGLELIGTDCIVIKLKGK